MLSEHDDVDVDDLRRWIEAQHKCEARFNRTKHVSEQLFGCYWWEGEMFLFELVGHPTATQCYAWSLTRDGKHRYDSVLKAPPVKNARDAVWHGWIQEMKAREEQRRLRQGEGRKE